MLMRFADRVECKASLTFHLSPLELLLSPLVTAIWISYACSQSTLLTFSLNRKLFHSQTHLAALQVEPSRIASQIWRPLLPLPTMPQLQISPQQMESADQV